MVIAAGHGVQSTYDHYVAQPARQQESSLVRQKAPKYCGVTSTSITIQSVPGIHQLVKQEAHTTKDLDDHWTECQHGML